MDFSQCPGLYIHVPFCNKRCGYCSFTSGVYDSESVSKYLGYIKHEAAIISSIAGTIRSTGTVFFGGGTPSVLSDAETVKLFGSLDGTFIYKKNVEISLEANPESLTVSKLKLIKQLGVNRLSIGVQSFDDSVLKYLGRLHSSSGATTAIKSAKAEGFWNLSIDLMYGIPGQTLEIWRRDIDTAVRLEPEHISMYCLSLEPEVRLYGEINKDWPNEDLQARMYYTAREILIDAGYLHYEISNFARSGYECRHNLKYWRDEDCLGLGPAAAFHWRGERYRNPANLAEYGFAIDKGKWPLVPPEISDVEREARTAVVLGLRLIDGINLEEYENRFGIDILAYYGNTIDKLIENAMLEFEAGKFRLTPQALFISDEVFTHLI